MGILTRPWMIQVELVVVLGGFVVTVILKTFRNKPR